MADLSQLSNEELLALRAKAAQPPQDLSGVSNEELLAMRDQAASNAPPSTAVDAMKSFGAGVVKGVTGLAGLPGDIQSGMKAAQNWIANKAGLPQVEMAPMLPFFPIGKEMPRSAETLKAAETVTGPLYKPQTMAGRFAETAGEFLPGMIGPGSWARKVIGGVAIPAVAAQGAYEIAPEPYKNIAKILGGIGGGVIGSLPVPTMGAKSRADQVIIDALTPDAQGKLNKLGPEAFLLEANPTTTQIAQGISQRPGPASDSLRKAITTRHEAAPNRLAQDVRSNFGPPIAPERVDLRISNAQKALSPEYAQALNGKGKVDVAPIISALDNDISKAAGAPKKTLEEMRRFFYDEKRLKDSTGELLAVRQAIDDLAPRIAGQTNAERLLANYRKMVDGALSKAAPEVKLVDAKFQQLARQRDALNKGGQILTTGKEATRPSQLAQDISKMSKQEQAALRLGARGEIDRVMGTSVFDVNALRNTVKSEGKWNHEKLAQIFGRAEADKVISAVDREVAFRSAYDRLVANSQTAPRLLAEEMTRVKGPGNLSPEMIAAIGSTMVTGSPAAAVPAAGFITGVRKTAEAVTAGGQRRLDDALSKALQLQGPARDSEIVRLLAQKANQPRSLSPGSRAILDALLASGSARAQ